MGVTLGHSVRVVGRGVPSGSVDLGTSGAFTLEIARQKSLSPHTIYFIERDPNEIELPRIVAIELGDEGSVRDGLLIDFSEASAPAAEPYEADIGIAAGLLDCEYCATDALRLNLGLFEDGMGIEDAVHILRGGYEEASWGALTHQALRHHVWSSPALKRPERCLVCLKECTASPSANSQSTLTKCSPPSKHILRLVNPP